MNKSKQTSNLNLKCEELASKIGFVEKPLMLASLD